MADSQSNRALPLVQRLFEVGAVGTMPDPMLLDWVVSRDDDAAEAAFEELVIRHGPMVLRVCRGVLHDAHDAEDAFQAVFLVLANRARSIRRSGSIASWLFGVAQRVATRSNRSNARRRAFDQFVAERKSECTPPAENNPDWEILHEELGGLPERLRAPIVLCYLQGLTYAAAAHQLGLSEVAIRGRLARARDQLRQRLTRRGVTAPASLLVAGAADQAQAAIPMSLIHCTARIALGFNAGNAAAVLARGVLNSMLFNQLKLMMALLCLGIGGISWAWHAFASAVEGKGQTNFGPAVVRAVGLSQPPRNDFYGDPLPPGATMRLGTVRYRQDERFERIAYSSDGRFVVTDNGKVGLQVWDAWDGRKVRSIELGLDPIRDIAFSPDGKILATAGFVLDQKLRLVVYRLIFTDFATGRQIVSSEGGQEHAAMRIAFAPDGKTIATVNDSDTLRFWDVASGKLSFETSFEREHLSGIAFSPDTASHLLAVSGRTVHLWNVADRREVRHLGHPDGSRVSCLAFSNDGKALATPIGFEGAIQVWGVADGRPLQRLTGKNSSVHAMLFSPDGKLLAATGREGHLTLWNLDTGQENEPFATEGLADGPLAFSPDGRTIASRGGDSALHFWDRTSGEDRLATPDAHLGAVQSLLFLDGGKSLISGSDDRTARIWDLSRDVTRPGHQRTVLKHSGWVRTMALSNNQHWLLTGSSYPSTDKEPVHLWHLPTGKLRRRFPSPGQTIHPIGARFSREGDSILVCWSDGSLRHWDTLTDQERPVTQLKLPGARPQFAGNFARNAIFSPDGQRLAVIENMGGAVRLADLDQGKELFAVPRGYAVAFSPDGQSLAVAEMTRYRDFKLADGQTRSEFSPDTMVYVLDGRTGQERRKILVKGASLIEAVAFSPDGKTLAVGQGWNEPNIHLFDVADGREVQTIATPARSHGSFALAFTPDGKRLVSGMSDTSILIWDARPRE